MTEEPNKRWQLQWKPHAQTAGYLLAMRELAKQTNMTQYEVNTVCINGVGRSAMTDRKVSNDPTRERFKRVYIFYENEEIAEWQSSTVTKVTRMREDIENNRFALANSMACHMQYGRPCNYVELCSRPPRLRQTIIDTSFNEVPRWIPYELPNGG